MNSGFYFLEQVLLKQNDLKKKELILVFPQFLQILSTVLDKKCSAVISGKQESALLLNFWIVKKSEIGLSVQASASPRARKLSEKIKESDDGAAASVVRLYFHNAITQGPEFKALITEMQQISKSGQYSDALAVGANLIFLFQVLSQVILDEACCAKNVLSIPPLGVFWFGLKKRHANIPEYDPKGYLQWDPSFYLN